MLGLSLTLLASFSLFTHAGKPPIFIRDLPNYPTFPNNGSTALSLASDRQSYYTVIRTGEINFRVAVDTASADLLIFSSDCESDSCDGLPRYPLAYQSPTFLSVNDNNTAFNVSFADNTVASGFVCRETVTLANMTLPDQAFGMITESNLNFVDMTSGVLGLGFPRLSTISRNVVNATPFFSRLAADGYLAYPLFGISATGDDEGSISLGAIDTSVVRNISDIEWYDVVEFPPLGEGGNSSSYLHWVIPMESLWVGDVEITVRPTYPAITGSSASLALLDIGTSGIFGPYQDVERIFSAIESARFVGDGLWAVPCDYTGGISFVFGARNFSLLPEHHLIAQIEGNPNLCLSWPIALEPNSDGIDWQFGAPFLRTVYSVYSYGINGEESPKIGLYSLENRTSGVTSEPFLSTQVAATLPNSLLPSPTYTTPTYVFNTSYDAPTGGIVFSQLATSTYQPILGTENYNASAIPTISPLPSVYTLIVTNSIGVIETTTSTVVVPSVTLGVPPGWSGGSRTGVPILSITVVSLSVIVLQLLWDSIDF